MPVNKDDELEILNPSEFAPGCQLDWDNDCVIGASGVVYKHLALRWSEIQHLLAEAAKLHFRPPMELPPE